MRLVARSQFGRRVIRMHKQTSLILFIVSLLLMLAAPVAAQTPAPPTVTPTPSLGVVSGQIVNRSRGGTVPVKLDLVLHAWDQNSNEKLMRDGQSNPDGTFRFEDVPIESSLLYGVMAVYNGITYFSMPVEATGQSLTGLEIPIYETTVDTSNVQIDQLYVVFLSTPAGLEVNEVYRVLNGGDRTVKDAVKLADDQVATLRFPLPSEAINLAFDPAIKNELLRTSDGFAFAGALLPGDKPTRIAVRYMLPYQSGMTYTLNVPYVVRSVSYMVPADSDLSVTGEGLTDGGLQTIDANRQLAVKTRGALQAGEKAIVILTGQPKISNIKQPVPTTPVVNGIRSPEALAGVAGIVFTLGLIVFGWRWFRRPGPALILADESDELSPGDSVAQPGGLAESRD